MNDGTMLCSRCGKTILFIQMPSGKNMPVDARPVRYIPNPEGSVYLYERNGKRVRGDLTALESIDAPTAYLPHWGSCKALKDRPKKDEHWQRAQKVNREPEPKPEKKEKKAQEPNWEQQSMFPPARPWR